MIVTDEIPVGAIPSATSESYGAMAVVSVPASVGVIVVPTAYVFVATGQPSRTRIRPGIAVAWIVGKLKVSTPTPTENATGAAEASIVGRVIETDPGVSVKGTGAASASIVGRVIVCVLTA